jgi:hypothetical protein
VLCAETTLLVAGRVALAFLRAGEACYGTSFDHPADEMDIRRALPYRDATGSLARLAAVNNHSNQGNQLVLVLA